MYKDSSLSRVQPVALALCPASVYWAPIHSTDAQVLINDESYESITKESDAIYIWTQHYYLFNGTGTTKIMIQGAGEEDSHGANIDGVKVVLSQTQPIYHVKYYFSPNEEECELCRGPSRPGEPCDAPVPPQTDCYAYLKNTRLVPVHCWFRDPQYKEC